MTAFYRSVLCLLLAGCNPVFGLDATDIDTDADGDGVFDAVDLCPALADDQTDSDRDGVGDACDLCPFAADPDQHDEDGDRQGDACDPCPGQQDFSDDEDHDGIGDACDPFAGLPSRRLRFDPFVSLASEWTSIDVPWDAVDDRAVPLAPLAVDDGLVDTTLLMPATVDIDIGVISRGHWEAGEQFGVRIVDAAGAPKASCIVTCPARNMCTLLTTVTGSTVGYAIRAIDNVSVHLRLVVEASFPRTYCFLDNNAVSSFVSGAVPEAGGQLVLIASPNAQIASVDVVGHGQ